MSAIVAFFGRVAVAVFECMHLETFAAEWQPRSFAVLAQLGILFPKVAVVVLRYSAVQFLRTHSNLAFAHYLSALAATVLRSGRANPSLREAEKRKRPTEAIVEKRVVALCPPGHNSTNFVFPLNKRIGRDCEWGMGSTPCDKSAALGSHLLPHRVHSQCTVSDRRDSILKQNTVINQRKLNVYRRIGYLTLPNSTRACWPALSVCSDIRRDRSVILEMKRIKL